jgi:hypothetical protein
MAKLMDENQHPEHLQEGDDAAEGFRQKIQEQAP